MGEFSGKNRDKYEVPCVPCILISNSISFKRTFNMYKIVIKIVALHSFMKLLIKLVDSYTRPGT